MSRKKLTDKGIERKTPPKSGRIELWDSECPGFGVRITDRGVRSFQLMYRFNGKLRRKGLGRFIGEGSLSKARQRAREIIELARGGIDPEEQEKALAEERARAQADTFAAVRDQFIEKYAKPKNRSWQEVERYFKRDLADWNARPISSITRRDVIAAIDAKAHRGGPYSANRLLAHVRKLFNWGLSRDLISASPVAGIPKPRVEKERERVLSEREIKLLWDAWSDDQPEQQSGKTAKAGKVVKVGWPFGPMLRLLLITGQRRDEVAGMRWQSLRPRPLSDSAGDVTPIEWVWSISGEETKGGRSHDVSLAPLAREILGSLPRFNSDYVFPARGNGDRYASGFSKGKARSDAISGVSDWRIHDLRRTCGTGMASLGIAVSTIGRVLNHAPTGVTSRVYDKFSYAGEKRRALETWAHKLTSIVAPAPAAVADLAKARAARARV